MVIRKVNDSVRTTTIGKLQGTYCKLHQHGKRHRTINNSQEEVKNTISELKNTGEGNKSRPDDAENQINKLEDEVEKKSQTE